MRIARRRFLHGLAMLLLAASRVVTAQQPVMVRPASLIQQPDALPAPSVGSPTQPNAPAPLPGAIGTTPLAAPPARVPPPDARVLTLADFEQLALSNNPSIARAMALVEARRGNWTQVGLPPNISWGYLGQQLGSGNNSSQHAMLVDGELVTGGKLRWNRQIAEQEIRQAEQTLFAQQQRVLTDVRIAFYEALLAQRGLELADQLLSIARESQGAAARLRKAGETARVDERQADIEAFNAENSVAIAKARHFAAWQTLRAVTGLPYMTPVVLQGDLESIPDNFTWEGALGRLQSISPEIGAALANVERARAALVRARRKPIPNVRFQGGPMQDMGYGGKTDGIVQMLLPLPIINRNQGGIRQAEAELVAAERAVEQVELDLQNRLAPVYEQYASASDRVRRFRDSILPAAQEALEYIRKGYLAGELPFLNLLNAQRTFFQTNQAYLEALLQLRSATTQIEGLLLSNSLGTAP